MSGIVGSYFNTRGSGVVAKLGTDGQVFTSTGAGLSQGFEAAGGGAWNLIQTLTSDGSDANLSFTSGLDSTYDAYCFKLINIHPETDQSELNFNVSIDGGSNYNVAKTTSSFRAYNKEDDAARSLAYDSAMDLAQGTGVQLLAENVGNDNDNSASGFLYLFAPSSTTFVKHFITRVNATNKSADPHTFDTFIGGYANTTSAVDAIQFIFSSGEIQGGKIKMYGIS